VCVCVLVCVRVGARACACAYVPVCVCVYACVSVCLYIHNMSCCTHEYIHTQGGSFKRHKIERFQYSDLTVSGKQKS